MAGASPGLTTVVDAHPRFWCEFVLWTICSDRFARAAPRRVYFIGDTPAELVQFAARYGLDQKRADTLLPASPHCNKLIPFLDQDGFEDQIVTDNDVFVLDGFLEHFQPEFIRLPPNSHGNPPLLIFKEIFAAAGIDKLVEPGLSIFRGDAGRETYALNVNAGVISIPSAYRDFAKAWRDRAEWLIENRDLMGAFRVHVDQVAFCMAAAETDAPFSFWPPQGNAIPQLWAEIETVTALHISSDHVIWFPKYFADDKTVPMQKINPKLTEAFDEFNECVREAIVVMESLSATREFVRNFFNPAYRRS